MIFKWADGFRGKRGVKADAAGRFVSSLAARGRVDAERLVEASTPASAPTHALFTWDDKKAAREFRLVEARCVLRSLVVVSSDDGKSTVRAFHNVNTEPDADEEVRAYVAVAEVASDEDMTEQVVARCVRDLRSVRDRYAKYKQLRALVAGIDRLIASAKSTRRRGAA